MKIIINRVYPNFAEQKMYIQWEVESPPSVEATFDVFRSESPTGGFEQIASNLRNTYFYVDQFENTPGFFSLDRSIYYKVAISCSGERAESNPVYFDGAISADPMEQRDVDASYRHMKRNQYDKQLRLLRNKLILDFKLGLEKIYGISAILLKRKRWGTRCGLCYDPIANKQIKSHCDKCYDTTWVGGYIPTPILVHEQKPMPIQSGKDIPGPIEIKQTSFSTLYFPKINYDDIIAIRYNNTRYHIKSVSDTYIRTIPIHQTIISEIIPPDHIVYKIDIDTMEGMFNV